MARLLVKNRPNTHLTGEVIVITPDTHEFGRREDKAKFLAELPNETWPSEFVIVDVNCNVEDVTYLLETLDDGSKRYFITPQVEGSPFYNDLLNHAKCTSSIEYLTSQVIDRLA